MKEGAIKSTKVRRAKLALTESLHTFVRSKMDIYRLSGRLRRKNFRYWRPLFVDLFDTNIAASTNRFYTLISLVTPTGIGPVFQPRED